VLGLNEKHAYKPITVEDLLALLIYVYLIIPLSIFSPEYHVGCSLWDYFLGFLVVRFPFVYVPVFYFVFVSPRRRPRTSWNIKAPILGFHMLLIVEPFYLWLFSLVNEFIALRFLSWVFMLSVYFAILPILNTLIVCRLKIEFSRTSKRALGLTYIAYATIVTIFNIKATWLLNLDSFQRILITALYVGSAVIILTGIFLREVERSLAKSREASQQQ